MAVEKGRKGEIKSEKYRNSGHHACERNTMRFFYLRPTKHIIRTFYVSYSLNVSGCRNFCHLISKKQKHRNEHSLTERNEMKLNFYSHLISSSRFLFLCFSDWKVPKENFARFCAFALVANTIFGWVLSFPFHLPSSLVLFAFICRLRRFISMSSKWVCYKLCSRLFSFFILFWNCTHETHTI